MDDAALTILICERLGAIPTWAWRPTGPSYTEPEVGVFYGSLAATPNRAVGVRLYAASDDEQEALHWRRVQLRFRGLPGLPSSADALAGLAFASLQGLSRVGGISGISRLSMAPAGADENGREERTDNYTITLDNLEALS